MGSGPGFQNADKRIAVAVVFDISLAEDFPVFAFEENIYLSLLLAQAHFDFSVAVLKLISSLGKGLRLAEDRDATLSGEQLDTSQKKTDKQGGEGE
jgi:hypothetical protein